MKQMTSGIRSSSYSLARSVTKLKKAQDDTTARMGSDSVGVFGTSDPDFIGFTTAPFKTMLPVTVQSGAGLYSTIAVLPDQQHATIEDRYYNTGTPFVMDRAGTANASLNILRSGLPPDGYYGGTKLMVQRRYKRSFRKPIDGGDTFTWIYDVEVRREEAGYALQAGERLDGDFFPGSIYLGINRPYGWTFPLDTTTGRRRYNQDPFTEAGWSGVTLVVPDNPATKPTISGISPSSYVIGSGTVTMTITGTNFTDCGFALIGPFLPEVTTVPTRDPEPITSDIPANDAFMIINPDGAYYYRNVVSDTTLEIAVPQTVEAGVWDVFVIGNDGQIGQLEKCFTVTEA